MHCSEGLFIKPSDSSLTNVVPPYSMGSQLCLQAVGGETLTTSTARLKESKTGQPTHETMTQGKCCASPMSLQLGSDMPACGTEKKLPIFPIPGALR